MVLNCMLSQFDRIIGTTYPSGAHGLGIVFCGFRVAHSQSIVFCVLICGVLLFWSLYCLHFFVSPILIISLGSSNLLM
jgi:hypothetical protein